MDLRKGSQDLLETRIQVAQEEGGGPAAALVQSWEILPVLDLGYIPALQPRITVAMDWLKKTWIAVLSALRQLLRPLWLTKNVNCWVFSFAAATRISLLRVNKERNTT
ncbi:hypothetical protein BD769DRAFT_1669570 [Suillus cothurnatus]|nr:hypothetical protein BD769DRAFT_1669570 [Suillus cothurnatus]